MACNTKWPVKLAVLTFLAGCALAPKNSLIVGRLPIQSRCLAILPFSSGGTMALGEKAFLEEFLVSDLFKEGFADIVHPKEIAKAFADKGVAIPLETEKDFAVALGRGIGVDIVMWGNVETKVILEKSPQGEERYKVIAVEAYLAETGNADLRWYYDAKKMAQGRDDVKTLSQISSEMTWGLLKRARDEGLTYGAGCAEEDYGAKLATYVDSLKESGAAIPLGVVARGPAPEKPTAYEENGSALSESEKRIYRSLAGGKKVVLEELKFDGRTANISKDGLFYLTGLARVIKSFGEGYSFDLEGHVDSSDDSAKDLALSLEKAKSVKDFLLKFGGIRESSLRTKGLGGQMPILPNINKRSREKNNRIELTVVKNQ